MANKVRNFLNQNNSLVTVAAVALMALSLGAIWWQLRPPTIRVVDVYYYDLGTNKLFTAKSSEFPPIQAPSGISPPGAPAGSPGGVRAYVFSCTGCEDKESQFIGWLEMYTPQVKDMIEHPEKYQSDDPNNPDYAQMEMWENGHLYRRIDEDLWVQANSEAGYQIIEEMQTKCGPEAIPEPCMPG